jgi:hypothetical protein
MTPELRGYFKAPADRGVLVVTVEEAAPAATRRALPWDFDEFTHRGRREAGGEEEWRRTARDGWNGRHDVASAGTAENASSPNTQSGQNRRPRPVESSWVLRVAGWVGCDA